jgi:hypothetical protein
MRQAKLKVGHRTGAARDAVEQVDRGGGRGIAGFNARERLAVFI